MALRKRKETVDMVATPEEYYNKFSTEKLLIYLDRFAVEDTYFGVTPCYGHEKNKGFVCAQMCIVSDIDEDDLHADQGYGAHHGKTIREAVVKACIELEVQIK